MRRVWQIPAIAALLCGLAGCGVTPAAETNGAAKTAVVPILGETQRSRDASDELEVKRRTVSSPSSPNPGALLLDVDSLPLPGSEAARSMAKRNGPGEIAGILSLGPETRKNTPAGLSSSASPATRLSGPSWLPADPLVLRAGASLRGPRFASDLPVSEATSNACFSLREHALKSAQTSLDLQKRNALKAVGEEVDLACEWFSGVVQGRASYATAAKVLEKYQAAGGLPAVLAAFALAVNNSVD